MLTRKQHSLISCSRLLFSSTNTTPKKESAASKVQTPPNPFLRAQQNRAQQQHQKSEKKIILEKKSNEQIKVELSRKLTTLKLRIIPFLKSLDASFFVRLVFFCSVVYFFAKMVNASQDSMVAVQEEKSNSANKFSKTFGQEKQLDSILESLREDGKEEGENQQSKLKEL